MERKNLDLGALTEKLSKENGPRYWRSLEELSETPEFQEKLQREFPVDASVWNDPISRRSFMKVMGASFGLAGLTSCSKPFQKIIPYVKNPEYVVPGRPLFFASAMTLGGYARGVLVESHTGRPTKVEGNPDHPYSLGATDVFMQGELLNMYDPDRSKVALRGTQIASWENFVGDMSQVLDKARSTGGEGLALLTDNTTSPTLTSQIQRFLEAYPKAHWYSYEPVTRDLARRASVLAFGKVVDAHYDFSKAKVVLSLDADFLCFGPAGVRYARQFAEGRKVRKDNRAMNRLYAVEVGFTSTGGSADHRLPVRQAELQNFALALASELGALPGAGGAQLSDTHRKWAQVIARDLGKNRGSSIVVVGEHQSPELQALGHLLNSHLNNSGQTVVYREPADNFAVSRAEPLNKLVNEMNGGRVSSLFVLGANPVYATPAELKFAEAYKKVGLRVRMGHYEDETSALSHWHLPQTHELESWGDARAFDGTVSIIQPLIAPLYRGKTPTEFMEVLASGNSKSGHDILKDYWKEKSGALDFNGWWEKTLHDGVVPNTASAAQSLSAKVDAAAITTALSRTPATEGLEIHFRPDPHIWDGRYANNGWLQELPKPITKVTWDNAVYVSPATAAKLKVSSNDEVEIALKDQKVKGAIWIVPGQSDNTIIAHLGYGRTSAGRVGNGPGYNAYDLMGLESPAVAFGVQIKKTGHRYELACTQDQQSMEGRDIVRAGNINNSGDVAVLNGGGGEGHGEGEGPLPSLIPEYKYTGYAWGMSIDMSSCTGCNSCVIACVAENNTPVVGKIQVKAGRAMHWLRIDRYFSGPLNNIEAHAMPVLCMHCEKAPCEVVCPVAATVHDSEGLNTMVYNRCVGTRYCSNNCPYKVRRFNFLQFSDPETPVLKLMRNPDVTVRSRGVMEKCSYCVQRISRARIEAEKETRKIRDGEVVTACQQACPTGAIVFGDINDPNSRVTALKKEPANYGLMAELGTQPRTSYMTRWRNHNPELQG